MMHSMNVAMLTKADLKNPASWESLFGIYTAAAHCADALKNRGIGISHLGPLVAPVSREASKKAAFYKERSEIYFPGNEPEAVQDLARQVEEKIAATPADCILCCCDGLPLAYTENVPPAVMFRDTTVSAVFNYYPQCKNICRETRQMIFDQEKMAYERAARIFFSSEWAADQAIDLFHLDPKTVQIMPFGANIEREWKAEEVREAIASRQSSPCRLAFIGNDWQRKGADIAIAVTEQLNAEGFQTELIIAGGQIPGELLRSPFVRSIGQIDDRKKEDILASAHFFLFPTRAECFGFVLLEANAYGVPCLATDTGGVSAIIQNHVNGQLFPVNAPVSHYCNVIKTVMADRSGYDKLAMSSFSEYERRFRWSDIAGRLESLMENLPISRS